jgi:hypothetical protein
VRFAKSANNRWMILDAEPTPEGNVVLRHAPGMDGYEALVFRDAEAARTKYPMCDRFLDHHVSCPQSKEWKQGRPL